MGRAATISKLQTGDPDLDRVQEHLRQQLNPVLENTLLSASDFRWTQLNGADQTKADSWVLQFRSTGTTWTTILTVDSTGAVTAGAITTTATSSSIAQPAWTAPAFLNSWTNFGAGIMTAAYYKDTLGTVHLRGSIKNGTVGAAAFTLPAGYRPSARTFYPVISNAGGATDIMGEVEVNSLGDVKPVAPSGNVFVGLDGITFDTRS